MKILKLDRFSSLFFRGGLSARNRVVVPAMASETGDEQGNVTDATVTHYARLAEAQTGIVMVEYTYVHPSGKSEPRQLGLTQDSQIEGFSRVSKVIKNAGALSFLQLTHAGGKSSRDLTGGRLIAASPIPVPVKDRIMEAPEEMTHAEIAVWKDAFLSAAYRAEAAGFHGIELHSAHGYGLNQWLSPITNQRTDAYGGSLANRSRFFLEIIASVRAQVPQLLISVRIPGQDFIDGGLTTQDMQQVAASLKEAGVDLINVSSGIGGWRRPGGRDGEGYLVNEAKLIQSSVDVPVIGVGGIKSGAFIDQVIGVGAIALAAVGRAILKNPDQFRKTVFDDRVSKGPISNQKEEILGALLCQ